MKVGFGRGRIQKAALGFIWFCFEEIHGFCWGFGEEGDKSFVRVDTRKWVGMLIFILFGWCCVSTRGVQLMR